MDLRAKAIIKTLLISLGATLTMSGIKIFYGKSNHSLAFVADGIHSTFDATATFLGIITIVWSSQPPDEGHPYGHQKFEAVSAMTLSVLLLLAAYEVGSMAYQRILAHALPPNFSVWGFVILVATMGVNLGVAQLEKKNAKNLGSTYLLSDAVHNQSDFWITLAVLVTVVSAYFQIQYVDAMASIAITFYLVFVSLKLLNFNIKPLVDSSVLDPRKVEELASSVEGVLHCHHIRSRGNEGHLFLDLNIHLPGHITLHRAHEITHRVEEKLKAEFPGLVDVVIHTEPDGHPPCSNDT